MKKFLPTSLFVMLIVFFSSLFASVNPKEIIKKGTKLIYTVNYSGNLYEFTITIKDQANAYSFDWSRNSPANNKKVSVNVTNEAIQNAAGLFNYFAKGEVNLEDQLGLILSRKMFNVFKDNGSMEIYTDKKNDELSIFGNPYNHTQSFGHNNDYSNEFDCRTVTNGNDYQITYVNDPDFPLVIEMNLGWALKLKNIIN